MPKSNLYRMQSVYERYRCHGTCFHIRGLSQQGSSGKPEQRQSAQSLFKRQHIPRKQSLRNLGKSTTGEKLGSRISDNWCNLDNIVRESRITIFSSTLTSRAAGVQGTSQLCACAQFFREKHQEPWQMATEWRVLEQWERRHDVDWSWQSGKTPGQIVGLGAS
jgi:hypothetical protein